MKFQTQDHSPLIAISMKEILQQQHTEYNLIFEGISRHQAGYLIQFAFVYSDGFSVSNS